MAVASSLFSIAWPRPAICARMFSETTRPAGSSPALLMRRPLLSRSSERENPMSFRDRLRYAFMDAMLWLIRNAIFASP